jgi:hypothetical protein
MLYGLGAGILLLLLLGGTATGQWHMTYVDYTWLVITPNLARGGPQSTGIPAPPGVQAGTGKWNRYTVVAGPYSGQDRATTNIASIADAVFYAVNNIPVGWDAFQWTPHDGQLVQINGYWVYGISQSSSNGYCVAKEDWAKQVVNAAPQVENGRVGPGGTWHQIGKIVGGQPPSATYENSEYCMFVPFHALPAPPPGQGYNSGYPGDDGAWTLINPHYLVWLNRSNMNHPQAETFTVASSLPAPNPNPVATT